MAEWEIFFLEVIKGKRKGLIPFLIKIPLLFLSLIYACVVSLRNFGYDIGFFKQHKASIPVISVGNISVGGTGKTPVTLHLAKALQDKYQIAIISRGYRSQSEKLKETVVLSKGEGPLYDANYCGDEPYLLSENLPQSHIFVGTDRLKSSDLAVNSGANLIILDDGMQHRKLCRDYEVVVIDGKEPFGYRYQLPRGLLREGKKSLRRADFIVLNHVTEHSQYNLLKKKLSEFSKAPIASVNMEKEKIIDLNGNEIDSIKGKIVGVFCGIANPQYFYQTVEKLGAHVVASKIYSDHKVGDDQSLLQFANECKNLGADLLICTEKDKVKLQKIQKLPLPIFYVKMQLEVTHGKIEWDDFIKMINLSSCLTGK